MRTSRHGRCDDGGGVSWPMVDYERFRRRTSPYDPRRVPQTVAALPAAPRRQVCSKRSVVVCVINRVGPTYLKSIIHETPHITDSHVILTRIRVQGY